MKKTKLLIANISNEGESERKVSRENACNKIS